MTKDRKVHYPVDEKTQKYNWVRFKDLEIGEKFVFSSAVQGSTWANTGIGTCQKVSPRKYRYKTTVYREKEVEILATVGTVEVITVRLDANGDPALAETSTTPSKGG